MTREEAVLDAAARLRALGMIAMAVSFADPVAPEMETILAHGPLPRLASMAAGVLDRTQDGLFTDMTNGAGRYNALLRAAFLTPNSQMSVSICVDGEWKRLTTPQELQATLS